MRLRHLIAGALALALFSAPLAALAQAPACEYTVESASKDLTAASVPFVVLDGDLRDEFLQALAAAITLKAGEPAPDMSSVTRVLIAEIQGDQFFGLEFPDGCLSAPLPLAAFFPPTPRSGKDALGTHS